MIARRDLLLGGLCVAAAGTAYALEPRRRVTLLGGGQLSDVVPYRFADWTSRDDDGLVAPKTEGSLSAKLYSQTVGRVYEQAGTGALVLMLLAYGDTQSDQLQLHRPESCYPAFGFNLTDKAAAPVPLGGGVEVPGRQLVASAPGRDESIVYWSRLGEYFPTSSSEQRRDRLRTAMKGDVVDGLLARFSALGAPGPESYALLHGFVAGLVRAVPADRRAVLIGTERARLLKTRDV